MQNRTWLNSLFAGVTASAMIVSFANTPAIAADEEEEGANAGALSVNFNNDFTTKYMFRGIRQEGNEFIWQPSLDLSLNVYSCEEGALRSTDVGLGIWNSVHSEETGASGDGPDALYETDVYPSLSFTWAGGLTTAFTYYFYTSPNNAFDTIQEAVFDLSWDDLEVLGEFALNPTASFIFETDNSRFGPNSGRGNAFEFSVQPGLEVVMPGDECNCYPVALSFPATLGLSMDSYYNDGIDNDAFGFATLGVATSVPLSFIDKTYGSWYVGANLDLYFLGDATERANDGDWFEPVFTGSIGMDY